MDIVAVLKQAQFETEIRAKWIAVFDRRSEFRTTFGTDRIGKIQDDHFYITPAVLQNAAEILINGAGHVVAHLPSSDRTRGGIYPGVAIDSLSEEDLSKFLAILRNSIESHIKAGA